MKTKTWPQLAFLALFLVIARSAPGQQQDSFADTWVATDALGRNVPRFPEVSAPRADRAVGIFYFLWHGAHVQGGPFDVTKILAADPDAMQKQDSPLWGPLHVPHHWGESIFGYYLTDDEGVLRKHAQMLGDAGVDVVIFDVTNQITYRDYYRALLRVWSEMRRLGNRTPQVAFLTPFWDPAKVTRELWRDLYSAGLHRDLWFQWVGKPLILADPELIFDREENANQDTPAELQPGHTLGQSFITARAVRDVAARCPTWNARGSAVTLTLLRGGPGGERIAAERFHDVGDNAWLRLKLKVTLPAGTYYLVASEPDGRVGWWSHSEDNFARGEAFADGRAVAGDRTLRFTFADGDAQQILDFFTFRKPQPDYFQGQTKPDTWSWLEVSPQHVFTNSAGQKEQMSVGVGQNAVHGRLGSMSEAGAQGRSFHNGATDPRPDAVRYGFNVAEQWKHALTEDPRFIFVTGWNEWIAGRFAEFNRIKQPVMFVDQFDHEHSRDIEPMRGGHGDDYHYQLASYVRRYKGARPLPCLESCPIKIDGRFEDWRDVQPDFRDTIGDQVRREHRGWATNVTYRNSSGRNDIVAAKTSWSKTTAWFYVRTREPIAWPAGTNGTDATNWMLLFLDTDADVKTGWLGYDFLVNRGGVGVLERGVYAASTDEKSGAQDRGDDSLPQTMQRRERRAPTANDPRWSPAGKVKWRVQGNELELAIPWKSLGLKSPPARLDFKWADNCHQTGDWTDFTLNGDAAPNDRFNYRAQPDRMPSR